MFFEKGKHVLLNVFPMKRVMRFIKRDKLSLGFIGTFKVLEDRGLMDYKLTLPLNFFRVHMVFHISMLKKYHWDT